MCWGDSNLIFGEYNEKILILIFTFFTVVAFPTFPVSAAAIGPIVVVDPGGGGSTPTNDNYRMYGLGYGINLLHAGEISMDYIDTGSPILASYFLNHVSLSENTTAGFNYSFMNSNSDYVGLDTKTYEDRDIRPLEELGIKNIHLN